MEKMGHIHTSETVHLPKEFRKHFKNGNNNRKNT